MQKIYLSENVYIVGRLLRLLLAHTLDLRYTPVKQETTKDESVRHAFLEDFMEMVIVNRLGKHRSLVWGTMLRHQNVGVCHDLVQHFHRLVISRSHLFRHSAPHKN